MSRARRDELAQRLLATFLGEIAEHLQGLDVHLLALEANPTDGEHVRAILRILHTLKGAARAAGVPLVEQVAHQLEARLSAAEAADQAPASVELETLFVAVDRLRDAADRLARGEALDDSPLAELAVAFSEGRAVQRPSAAPPASSRPERPAKRAPAEQVPEAPSGRPAADAMVRIPAEKLDELLAAASRLTIEAARLADRSLMKLSDEIADRIQNARLRPLSDAFETLPRVVRDIATARGKDVRLVTEGGDVQLDRAVLQEYRDALLHLVRNAVDHGIEPPDERRARGKPAAGLVQVSATLRGDRVLVTVKDDGAGLDTAAIGASLERRGARAPTERRDLTRLLFRSGISTRPEADPISGRGVGLDAVRAAMERIGGSIDVDWVPGVGTTFSLESALTIASIRGLLTRIGPHVIAIPTAYVERLKRVKSDAVRYTDGRPVLVTDDAPAPLISLARVLGPPLAERAPQGLLSIVLMAMGKRRLALVVDEILAEQEVVVRPILGQQRAGMPYVSGAALLPTGRVALVLNAAPVLAAVHHLAPAALPTTAEPTAEAGPRRRVLVVDDSITTRTLEQSVLESAGYDVLVAADGAEAWQLLQERGADLVVSDVEMPRMDGFALCEAIRASPRYQALPVVLVTALESHEQQARGLEVGADAYLGKSRFDQENLLDTIRQLLG